MLRRYLESALLTAFATRGCCERSGSRRRSSRTASTCRGGSSAKSRGRSASRLDLERRLPQAALHLQPRRHLSPHADDRAARALGEPELTAAQERELMQYLASRREGLFDWIVFHRPTTQDAEEIAARLGLDPRSRSSACSPTCRGTRSCTIPANAFPNMLEWLVQTCEYFATRPDLQLLIRVHPAEISGFPPSRQPILGELRAHPRAGAQHPSSCRRRAAEHLRADVAVQRRHHLRHQDGRRADQRRDCRSSWPARRGSATRA